MKVKISKLLCLITAVALAMAVLGCQSIAVGNKTAPTAGTGSVSSADNGSVSSADNESAPLTDNESASSTDGNASLPGSGRKITVTVIIDGSSAAGDGYDIAGEKEIQLAEESSAYDATKLFADELGYAIVCTDGYVTSIGGLGEKALTASSGWAYTVNDEWPTESAEKHIVQDGDVIIWTFYR